MAHQRTERELEAASPVSVRLSPTSPVRDSGIGAVAFGTQTSPCGTAEAFPFSVIHTTTSPTTAVPAIRQPPAPSRDYSDLLDCPVCMDSLVEPITLTCGHTFCRPCLVEVLSRTHKQCPTCRQATHIDPVSALESTIVKAILLRANAAQYAERVRSLEQARRSWSERHPIFFYNDVTFPCSPIRLIFFEERYRVMLQRETHGANSFVWLYSNTPSHAEAGTLGVICKIREAQALADGRWVVYAEAQRRVRLRDVWEEPQTNGLWYAQVERLLDTEPDHTELDELSTNVMATYTQLQRYVARVPRIRQAGVPELPPLPEKPTAAQLEHATWRMCCAVFALVHLGALRVPYGRALLEMTSTRMRAQWAEGCVAQMGTLAESSSDDDSDSDDEVRMDMMAAHQPTNGDESPTGGSDSDY